MTARARILLSNDDGIRAEGLLALAAAVEDLAELWVVAPEHEQSAASHSLSLHRPLRIREHAQRWYGVDGTPADCVYLAVNHVMKAARPTLVISGINHGPNLAEDVIYSGTVAAAMEGSLLGLPAIAFSLASSRSRDFSHAADFARSLVQAALAQPSLPPRMLLNVNVPAGAPVQGYEVTRLGRHSYGAEVIEKEDPRGRKYYWIGGTGYEHVREAGTDVTAVRDLGRASITPMMLDLTHPPLLGPIEAWKLPGFARLAPLP